MIISKDEIINMILLHKDELKSYHINRIGLFGSVIRHEDNAASDIDLILEFEPGKKNFKTYTGAYFFLKDKLGKEIDFVTEESLSPYIRPHILKEVEYVSLNH